MRSVSTARSATAHPAPDAASLVVDALGAINWMPGSGSLDGETSGGGARAAEVDGAALWGLPTDGLFGQLWVTAHDSLRGAELGIHGASA
ncbi:hypothetical protein OKJ48_43525 [Streptomyces kunmingensis]|uniref:Uncharacterized protein n=1 Tax=Streptomyces kunmingensis TaxID=68225 RepID=A0ABU6CQM7_9ACTN|nr:hypothetical protein [Streptomyces kunmingensis]MEB3967060.1 hypothetical protein [Streptomyces kunmingensis]